MKIIRRAFATPLTFPWKFKQTAPQVQLNHIPDVIAPNLLSLHDGFSYAYSSLIESLGSHDTVSLKKALEPRLYSRVKLSLDEIEKSATRLLLLNSEPTKLRIYNFSAAIGVYVDRNKNPARDQYMLINSFENMQGFLKSIPILSSKLPEDNPLMKHMMFYLSPSAPASICFAVDVVVRGPAPLSAVSQSIDMIYTEVVPEEVHVIRFESEKIIENSQADIAKKHMYGMSNMMEYATSHAEGMFKGSWIVTDIDNTMQGNPYVN